MPFRLPAWLCGLLISGLGIGGARAGDPPADVPEFQRDIMPIFEAKCIRCHGAKRRGGKLDMRTMDAMLSGGETGPAFQKGNSRKSLLIELIHYNEMPPKKATPKVTKAELDLLRRWIDAMSAAVSTGK